MDDLILARMLHVLAVVIWIGGVAMVTVVLLPAVRRGELGTDRFAAFKAIERRFVWVARGAVLLVGVTGFDLVARLGVWSRFESARFWWMHAMVVLWTVFALALFVIEPLGLHRHHGTDPDATLRNLQRVHIALLAFALLTLLGAVAGSHGWKF